MSDPYPGQDEEFDRWYVEEHMVETLAEMPGLTYAQRFKRDDWFGLPARFPGYLTVYGVQDGSADELKVAVAEQREAVAAARAANRAPHRLAIAPSMDLESVRSGIFLPTSARIVPSQVRS
ncbi:hypothetical protein [Jatrophihabitans sp.]|uniref:hypothetical protein n=1 Tax=Jatrophihabitans sp. TaxID=1932789 RepID=UPI0030C74B94